MSEKASFYKALGLALGLVPLMSRPAQALPIVRGAIVATGLTTSLSLPYNSGQLGSEIELQLKGTPWGLGGVWQRGFAFAPTYFLFVLSGTTSVWGSAQLKLNQDSKIGLLFGANQYTGAMPSSPTALPTTNYGPLIGLFYTYRWGMLKLRVTPTYVFYLQPAFTPWAWTTSGIPLADLSIRMGLAEVGLGLSPTPFRVGFDF